MKKIFLDSSVLLAACASTMGASAFILGYSKRKKVRAFVSLDVIGEARRNITIKFTPRAKRRLMQYLTYANLEKVTPPSLESIALCEEYINHKDAPILAAAKKISADFLITLDRKHFLQAEVIDFVKPIQILAPGEFVMNVLKKR